MRYGEVVDGAPPAPQNVDGGGNGAALAGRRRAAAVGWICCGRGRSPQGRESPVRLTVAVTRNGRVAGSLDGAPLPGLVGKRQSSACLFLRTAARMGRDGLPATEGNVATCAVRSACRISRLTISLSPLSNRKQERGHGLDGGSLHPAVNHRPPQYRIRFPLFSVGGAPGSPSTASIAAAATPPPTPDPHTTVALVPRQAPARAPAPNGRQHGRRLRDATMPALANTKWCCNKAPLGRAATQRATAAVAAGAPTALRQRTTRRRTRAAPRAPRPTPAAYAPRR